jgi:hypothetical protein
VRNLRRLLAISVAPNPTSGRDQLDTDRAAMLQAHEAYCWRKYGLTPRSEFCADSRLEAVSGHQRR